MECDKKHRCQINPVLLENHRRLFDALSNRLFTTGAREDFRCGSEANLKE